MRGVWSAALEWVGWWGRGLVNEPGQTPHLNSYLRCRKCVRRKCYFFKTEKTVCHLLTRGKLLVRFCSGWKTRVFWLSECLLLPPHSFQNIGLSYLNYLLAVHLCQCFSGSGQYGVCSQWTGCLHLSAGVYINIHIWNLFHCDGFLPSLTIHLPFF